MCGEEFKIYILKTKLSFICPPHPLCVLPLIGVPDVTMSILIICIPLLIMRARQRQRQQQDDPGSKLRRAPTLAQWSKPADKKFIQSLPKVEVHAHIGGSIRDTTLAELISSSDHPRDYPELQVLQGDQRSLSQCFQLFDAVHHLVSSLSVLRRITKETIEDFADENTIYLELRTTPRFDIPDVTPRQYVDTVVDTIRQCQREERTKHVCVRLLLSISRGHDATQAYATVELAGNSDRDIVVGLDFSGNPTKGNIQDYMPAFSRARTLYGLPISFHVGEINDPKEVDIILNLATKKDRLGHALYLTDEQTTQLLRRRLCVEICPTSNVRTLELGSYSEHPTLPVWLAEADYPMCLCTDDRGVFRTSLTDEYLHVALAFNLTRADVIRLARTAVHQIFDRRMFRQVESRATEMLEQVWLSEEKEAGGHTAAALSVRRKNTDGKRRGVTVIGITGASCSGKSTLSKALQDQFPTSETSREKQVHVLHCDDYRAYTLFGYRHVNEDGLRDWEHPSNAAWNAIQAEMQHMVDHLPEGSILLVDGHMILEDPRLRAWLNMCVYVHVEMEVCKERRMKRRMPAPKGWDPNEYFMLRVWNAHLEQHQNVKECCSDIELLTVDGTRDVDELVEIVHSAIVEGLAREEVDAFARL